ncbi:MAG: hypothetical protein JNK41_03500 [Saprospiraceae bacterium]|jgi:hypothetical protein|nr:hypothetical protein [Saprospiraceae bacterium]
MQLLKKFKSAILYFKLKTEIQRQKRVSKPKNIEDCKSILILFDADDSFNLKQILKRAQSFRENGKKVLLCGSTDKSVLNEMPFTPLTKKDVNWYGKPANNTSIAQLLDKEWDCILSLYVSQNPTLDYITAKSQASTKAGFYHQNTAFMDIMVDVCNQGFQKSLDDLLIILKTIKSRSYEPAV